MGKLHLFFILGLLSQSLSAQKADSVKVLDHLNYIVNTKAPRNCNNVKTLNYIAEYIYSQFELYADSVSYQTYTVDGKVYKNVICSFGTTHKERIIVGAHYDVCGNQDGADDNASGVVGLLELARLLNGQELDTRIDLVAFTLEEPPYFRTKYMGSYIHAKWLNDNKITVKGMVCLEMIGYFDDAKKSQHYPIGFLKLFYGSRGDYITVVSKLKSGKFARKFKHKMKRNKAIESKSFQAPSSLPGIDFSDHLNYWKFGYSAVMITNTAFYRNKNYHKPSDKIKTLNIGRMTAVIQAVFESVIASSQLK